MFCRPHWIRQATLAQWAHWCCSHHKCSPDVLTYDHYWSHIGTFWYYFLWCRLGRNNKSAEITRLYFVKVCHATFMQSIQPVLSNSVPMLPEGRQCVAQSHAMENVSHDKCTEDNRKLSRLFMLHHSCKHLYTKSYDVTILLWPVTVLLMFLFLSLFVLSSLLQIVVRKNTSLRNEMLCTEWDVIYNCCISALSVMCYVVTNCVHIMWSNLCIYRNVKCISDTCDSSILADYLGQ